MSDIEAGFLAAPVALLVTRHRVMAEFNDAFMAMFGYPREAMRDKLVRMLYPSISDYEAIGARAESWLRSHADHQDERFMQRCDGEIFMVRAHGRTLTPPRPLRADGLGLRRGRAAAEPHRPTDPARARVR